MDYNKKEQLLDKINGLRLTSTNASDTLYNRGVVDAFRRTNGFFDEELVPEVPQYVIDWYEENKGNLDYNLWNFIMDWDEQEPSEFINWFNRIMKLYVLSGSADEDIKQFIIEAVKKLSGEEDKEVDE